MLEKDQPAISCAEKSGLLLPQNLHEYTRVSCQVAFRTTYGVKTFEYSAAFITVGYNKNCPTLLVESQTHTTSFRIATVSSFTIQIWSVRKNWRHIKKHSGCALINV